MTRSARNIHWSLTSLALGATAILGGVTTQVCAEAPTEETGIMQSNTLFPTDLPPRDWVHFNAEGFSNPVCGVVYRTRDTVTNGVALGGIDTGCIDLETSGLLGYSTIFNSHVPRRGPINLPILGMSVGDETWVFCDPAQIKQGWGNYQGDGVAGSPIPERPNELHLDGIKAPWEIHYWGHYPVVDIEFDTDAPVRVGMRAWAPFLPGEVIDSMLPGMVFEIHLRNGSDVEQQGTVAFSFPGPDETEVKESLFERKDIRGRFNGVEVTGDLASYALGVIGEDVPRTGGGLAGNGEAWGQIATALPPVTAGQSGSSAAVGFKLDAGHTKVVRFAVTWCSPTWNGVGTPKATKVYEGFSGEARTFTHMYAKYYPSAGEAAQVLAEKHENLLKRILAWQEVIYTENKLPVWLRDSLINVLYMFAEDGMWAQAKDPIPSWVTEEDGLFGMNECPRGCPQIECIPCSFYGSLPIAYFFPKLELSTLRGYKGYQYDDGAPTWIFGGCTGQTPYIDFASPTRGYQWTSNGISLASLIDQFLLIHDTEDKKYLKEFYPMVKKNMEYTAGLRTTPEYGIGERLISMPDDNAGTEWFEAPEPGWHGMTAHVGGLHIAQLRIVERMAKEAGDTEFAQQCADWIAAAQQAMEDRLWTGSYYLNFWEPETNTKSELVFGYQLDGEWIVDHHGLRETLPQDRVKTVLGTIERCNIAVTKYGAVNYANPDATPAAVKGYGTYSYFPPEALMLAMTYMYNGQREFGVELARKVWHNLICLQGYTWDMPNIMRGDVDTGERTFGNDYYQDMMLWSLPAALEGKDLASVAKPNGLVYKVLQAASAK